MMENYQIDINKENKKTDDIYNIATEILKNAHRIAKVQTSSKDITEVIQNYDREKAIILIAQYINKYKNILNFLSKFTGRYIIYEPNFYIDKSSNSKHPLEASIFPFIFLRKITLSTSRFTTNNGLWVTNIICLLLLLLRIKLK